MSNILQCFSKIFGFVSDKQSGGAVKVVHKKIHTGEEQRQEEQPNEDQHLLNRNKALKEYGDSIQNEDQTESEAKLAPSSDGAYKTSEFPVNTDDANTKPEVPFIVAVQHDEVKYNFLFIDSCKFDRIYFMQDY